MHTITSVILCRDCCINPNYCQLLREDSFGKYRYRFIESAPNPINDLYQFRPGGFIKIPDDAFELKPRMQLAITLIFVMTLLIAAR